MYVKEIIEEIDNMLSNHNIVDGKVLVRKAIQVRKKCVIDTTKSDGVKNRDRVRINQAISKLIVINKTLCGSM